MALRISESLVIREAVVEDVCIGLGDVLRYLSPDSPDAGMAESLRVRQQAGIQTWVVEVDYCRVIATASLWIEPKLTHGGRSVAHIEDVVVHPDYRGYGIGRLLVERLLSRASNQQCYKAVLTCSEENRPLYEKIGFYCNELGMRMDF